MVHYDYDKECFVSGGRCYPASEECKKKMREAKDKLDEVYTIAITQFLQRHPECGYGVELDIRFDKTDKEVKRKRY